MKTLDQLLVKNTSYLEKEMTQSVFPSF